jgi:hypothetical protein
MLLAAVLLLAGCAGSGSRQGQAGAVGTYASAALEGAQLTLSLAGYSGEALPAVELEGASGVPWAEETSAAGRPNRAGDRVTLLVDAGRRLPGLLVEEIRYEWHLPDSQTKTGTVLYQDPGFASLNWQVTHTDGLTVFHTKPLAKEDQTRLEAAVAGAQAWTGRPPEGKLVVWAMPDQETLTRWLKEAGASASGAPQGCWDPQTERLLVVQGSAGAPAGPCR